VLGFTGGEIPVVKVNRLLLNNVDVVGVGWGALAYTTPDFMQEQWQEILPMIQFGALDPVLGAKYPLESGAVGVLDLQERRATGKVLLLP
jgi:NADPH2:quinone reductase